jgi:hypothetical protein
MTQACWVMCAQTSAQWRQAAAQTRQCCMSRWSSHSWAQLLQMLSQSWQSCSERSPFKLMTWAAALQRVAHSRSSWMHRIMLLMSSSSRQALAHCWQRVAQARQASIHSWYFCCNMVFVYIGYSRFEYLPVTGFYIKFCAKYRLHKALRTKQNPAVACSLDYIWEKLLLRLKIPKKVSSCPLDEKQSIPGVKKLWYQLNFEMLQAQ